MPTLHELLPYLEPYQLVGGALPAAPYTQVTADSRAVTPGALFCAVRGGTVDGHRYIAQALEGGAVAVLGSATAGELAALGMDVAALPYVQVANVRRALATAAALLYGWPSRSLAVIGMTGTDGKTTTATLLESILDAATRADGISGGVGVITTVGARIGGVESDTGLHVTTPDAPDVQRFLAEMRDAGCVYAVVESTSHGLDQERVAAVEFDVAAVTNITHEHLDYHGTRDAYVAAKARLFRALFVEPGKSARPRTAVLNADDAGSYGALRRVLAEEEAAGGAAVRVRSYGLAGRGGEEPDVAAHEIAYQPDRTRFIVRWWGGEFPLASQLIGEFNVYNVLCAATAALSLGAPPAAIQEGVAGLAGVVGRMERIDCGQPFTAVVDFAHTPVSLERALTTLRPLVGPGGRLISVFGSAGLRDRAKRRLMGQVSGRLADFTVVTAEDPRTEDLDEINRAIVAGVEEHAPPARYAVVPDRAEAIRRAVELAQPGDIVAAFGKGHERSMCYGETEYPWSDQDAMRAALEARRAGAGW